MIEALQRFVATLRQAGVRVSPAEMIDAARAVQSMGVERRDAFRAALKTTLCKTRDASAVFDRAFDRFFRDAAGTPGAAARPAGGDPATPGGRRRRPRPPEDDEPGPGSLPTTGEARGEERGRRRPARLRVLTPRAPHGRAASPAAGQVPQPPRRVIPPRRAGTSSRPRPKAPAPAARAGIIDPRRVDLSVPLSTAQERAVAKEVPRLLREIRLRAGRRLGRAPSGRLWTARVLRGNLGTGGAPFVLTFRRRRPRRPRALVLVDVSWSVMSASTFFLHMARAFLDARATGPRTSIHFFVDRCVEATSLVARWKGPGEVPLARLLEGMPDLDPKAASDYGRAFYQALRSRRGAGRAAGRDTILVVLGDARSNHRDPQAWAFEELASRCRRVLWLNPEPFARWNTGDSDLSEYLPFCDVVCEASDLEGIARGVSEIARSC